MSTQEKRLYQDINIKSNKKPDYGIGSKTYKGFSTTDPDQNGFNLYDFSLIKQDIINHCKEKLVSYKVPKSVIFVKSLPKNNTGKIDIQKLKKEHL